MKARINPGENLYQIVVADYSHRNNGYRRTIPPISPNIELRKQGETEFKPVKQGKIDYDYVPRKTLFRWAKSGRQAVRKVGKKFGSIISCEKVDSHYRRLNMIENLNLHQAKIEIENDTEFILSEDYEITRNTINIDGREIEIE